jgi:hypothetical protein
MILNFADIPFLSITAVVADQAVRKANVRLLFPVTRQRVHT